VFGLRLRSGVKPAIGLKTPRLTVGLKFCSDKNISKWPPRRLLPPSWLENEHCGYRSVLSVTTNPVPA
jgi:hypothetical protein